MPAILEGKVALVTGVSRDGQVGQTVAKVLAENGAALAICARTQSNVEERAEELRQAGARVLAVAASLTDEAQVRQLIEHVLSEYKKIDILVNLAGGLTCYKPAVEHCLDDWNDELNNNLLSAFLAFARSFAAHAGRGKLIPIDLKVGDRVLFGKWSGTEVKIDGVEYLIMKESDIMGVLEAEGRRKAA